MANIGQRRGAPTEMNPLDQHVDACHNASASRQDRGVIAVTHVDPEARARGPDDLPDEFKFGDAVDASELG